MLIILVTISILLIIIFGNGIFFGKILKINSESFSLTSLLGIMSVTFLETMIAFFFPLNFYIELIFIIIGIIGIIQFLRIKNYIYFDFKKNINFWFCFYVVIILFVASFSPYLYDHYSYYFPTISYLREAGFVKGISNLDLLLGQTSFWHIFQAGFSNLIDVNLRINCYLLILFLIYIYERKCWIFLFFIPLFLPFIQQPSPDLPIFVIALIVVNELMNDRNRSLILYLSLFAFCIKPIMFWLPLLLILDSFYRKRFNIKMLIPVLVFGSLFVSKNLFLFGFPVFPAAFIDFNLPWKPSNEILNYSSQIGLMKTYDMKYSYQQVADFNFSEKIYHWFTIGMKSVLNLAIVFCLVILGYFAFRKKGFFYKLLFVCFLIKFILIITFSAQYRFFIDLYLITIFLVFKDISEEKAVFTSVFLSIFISILFTFPGFVKHRFYMGRWMSGFQLSQLIKPTEFKSEESKSFQIGNLKFNVTKGLIYKTPFPALSLYWLKTYQYYNVFPQNSNNGFVQKKLTEKDKKSLKKIIDDLENANPKFP